MPGAPSARTSSASGCWQELLSECGSLDELPDAGLRDELTRLDEHVPAEQHDLR